LRDEGRQDPEFEVVRRVALVADAQGGPFDRQGWLSNLRGDGGSDRAARRHSADGAMTFQGRLQLTAELAVQAGCGGHGVTPRFGNGGVR